MRSATLIGTVLFACLAICACVPIAYKSAPALGRWQGAGWKEVCDTSKSAENILALPVYNPENMSTSRWGAELDCHGALDLSELDLSVSGSVWHPENVGILLGIPIRSSETGTHLKVRVRAHADGVTFDPYRVTLDSAAPIAAESSHPINAGEKIALPPDAVIEVTLKFQSYADSGTSQLCVNGLSSDDRGIVIPPVTVKRAWVSKLYMAGAAPAGPMHP